MTSVDGDPSVFLSIHGSNVQVIGTQYFMANAYLLILSASGFHLEVVELCCSRQKGAIVRNDPYFCAVLVLMVGLYLAVLKRFIAIHSRRLTGTGTAR